jgi:hypothetical protein
VLRIAKPLELIISGSDDMVQVGGAKILSIDFLSRRDGHKSMEDK